MECEVLQEVIVQEEIVGDIAGENGNVRCCSMGKLVGDIARENGNVRHRGGQQHEAKLWATLLGKMGNMRCHRGNSARQNCGENQQCETLHGEWHGKNCGRHCGENWQCETLW